MSSKSTWQRWIIPAAAGVLLAIAAVAIASQGAPTFGPPRIVLPDAGVTPPPRSPDVTTGTPEPQEASHPLHLDLSWLATALVVLAIAVALAFLWRYLRRRLRTRDAAPAAVLGAMTDGDLSNAPEEPMPEPVRRGLDRALDALTAPREPRGAIERAWLGLEEGAADSGVRRLPAETPGEFVARVIVRVGPDRAAARALLEIYQRVRFGNGPVTAGDVQAARDALTSLRASWQGEPAASRPGASRPGQSR